MHAVTIHKYIVLHKIGQGGFSTVYQAQHKNTQKIVALKIVKTPVDYNTILHESKILSYMNRDMPSNSKRLVPTLHWYGNYGKMMCLATTFYSKSFTNYLQDNTNIDLLKLLDICTQIIQIMCFIHGVFVIHCDIKPDNFMIDDDGKLVLIDFGMARLYVDSGNTSQHISNKTSNSLFGTPKYASYNLHLGNKPSRRDDMISVGYLMMTLFNVELPWSTIDVTDAVEDKKLYNIDHRSNVIRRDLKHIDALKIALTRDLANKFLVPYFTEVYALKYDEAPDYTEYNTLFNTL